MKKLLTAALPLLFVLSAAAFEENIVFAESFRKDKSLYKTGPEVVNGRNLAVTEDGVLCGRSHAAPILRIDPKKWDGADGAISFCLTPVDWESGQHDKEIVFFYTLLKNHGKKELGFKAGDTTMLLKMRRTNPKAREQLILQGQDGKMDAHRAYCVISNDSKFSFKPGKTTWIAFIWKKGGRITLYVDGQVAGSGAPYFFPEPEKLAVLSFMNGNTKAGFGVVDGTSYFTDLALVKGKVTIEELALIRNSLARKTLKKKQEATKGSSAKSLPVVPFPAPVKTPKLDGVLDEYGFSQDGFLHETTGLLTAAPGTFYASADADNLYLGAKIDVRDPAYQPVSSAVRRDDPALIASGDLAAVFLRSDQEGAARGFSGEYVTVAPNNTVYDAMENIDWAKNSCARDSSFDSGVTTFSRFDKGCWTVEMVIPRNKISVGNDFLFSFGFRIGNTGYLLRPYTYWFDHPDGFLKGRIVRTPLEMRLANPAAGVIDFRIKTAADASSILSSARSATSYDEVVVDQTIGEKTSFSPDKQLAAAEGKGLTIGRTLKNRGLYLIAAEAKDASGTIYRRSIPFSVRGMVDMDLRNNPVKKTLKAEVDFVGEKLRRGDRVVFELLRDGKVCQKTEKVISSSAHDATLALVCDTSKLAEGPYEVRIMRNGKKAATGNFVKKPLPEWLTHPVATEALKPDWVPEPWTPVTVDGQRIGVWGREFTFGEGGLRSIVSQGRTVLRAPMALRYRIGSETFTIPLKTVSVKQPGKGRAEVTVSGADNRLRAEFRHTIEFDGLDRVDCRLEAVGGAEKFDEIYLSLELDNAPYYMGLYDYCSQVMGYTGTRDFMRMTALWFGGDRAGLNTLFENHKDLLIDSAKPRFSVRKGEGEKAEYRICLGNARTEMKKPVSWRFALHPTPVKPLYDKWEDERPFMMEWFGYPFNFICLHTHSHSASSTDFAPRNWKLGKNLGKLAKAHKQKLYPYTIATFISRERAIKPDAPFTRYRLPDSYFYKIGDRPQTAEFIEFGEDWSFKPLSTFPGDGARHTEMIACSPAGSWSDYAVWAQAKYMKECGLAGFYYDLTTSRENFDEERGYKYTTLDGKVEGTRELFATRALLKRLYCAFSKVKGHYAPYIFGHGYPILSSASAFWGVSFHGEEYKPRKINGLAEMLMVDHQVGNPVMHGPPRNAKVDYSGVLWRLSYSPYVWGLPQIHLSQYALNRSISGKPQSGRELLALCFVNNTLFDPSYAHWQTGAEFHNQVTIPFEMSSAEFHGYWENGIKTSLPCVKVSYWKKKDGSDDCLVAVANWSPKSVVAEIELPDFLANAYFVCDMETVNRVFRWEDVGKKWKVSLGPCNLRVFRFIGKK